MPKKSSKKSKASRSPKTEKKECCCSCSGLNISFWPVVLIVVGVVWLVEHYTKTDIPLVAIVILLAGLLMLFKKDKK